MRGCKALSFREFEKLCDFMAAHYNKPVAMRNQTIFTLMVSTGLRIGETITLRICDVSSGGLVGTSIQLQRRYSKTKQHGSTIPLTPEARDALQQWLTWSGAYTQPEQTWLFPPSKGSKTDSPLFHWGRHVNDKSIRKVLDAVKKRTFIQGKVSTHSMRKTFAKVMYETLDNDLMATQIALRHANIGSTICYLQVNENQVAKAISKSFANFARH